MTTSIVALVRLTRFDTSGIVFLSVFIPLFYATSDFALSLSQSFPLLTIAMTGFVINDLADIEKDRENHPDRPLPSNIIDTVAASALYFSLLAISLVCVRALISASNIYPYLLLLIGLVNYNYLVIYFPRLKNFYVAFLAVIPFAILTNHLPYRQDHYWILAALVLLLVGREMLMDVQDVKSDDITLVKSIGVPASQRIAFLSVLTGDMCLLAVSRDTSEMALAVLLFTVSLLSFPLWLKDVRRRAVIYLMKLQILAGIYYVLPTA